MEITYNISLVHDDFILLLDLLKKAQTEHVANWDAVGFICENTKIEDKEL